MEIKEWVEKAIEGGYNFNRELLGQFDLEDACNTDYFKKTLLPSVVLDPKAWEAVGRVEGYGCEEEDCQCSEYVSKMHEMIDALCEGKSIEEFIKTLNN